MLFIAEHIAPYLRNAFLVNRRRCHGAIGCKRRLVTKKYDAHQTSSHQSHQSSPSILSNPLQWYAYKLDTHPITTKVLTSGFISGSGDLLCQYIVSKKKDEERENQENTPLSEESFDWTRTLRFTILGSFLVAPTVHVWYGHLMSSIPGTSISAVVKRLFFDQGLFAPLFTSTFISCLTVLEHVSPSDRSDRDIEQTVDNSIHTHANNDLFTHVKTRLINDGPDAILVGWSMWIPSMAFMFAFVPGKFQVLFSNGVGFVWNAYLSWKTHEGEEETDNH